MQVRAMEKIKEIYIYPCLGLSSRFSEVRAWRSFIYHLKEELKNTLYTSTISVFKGGRTICRLPKYNVWGPATPVVPRFLRH